MLKYKIYQNKNAKSAGFKKYYGRAVINETLDIDGLAKHMSDHNTPFSKGAITGILTDMVACIHELVLQGCAIKIDDLAIFSVGIRTEGAQTPDDFKVSSNVKNYRLRARATGQFTRAELQQAGSITEADEYVSGKTGKASGGSSSGGDTGGSSTGGGGTSGGGTPDDF